MRNATKTDSGKISKVYLYTGEVDSRRQAAVDKLTAQIVDADSAAFDLERFDGSTTDAQSILGAVITAPFMSDKKVVIVDRIDRLSADDQSRIAAFIPKLPDRSCLIMLANEDVSSKRKSSSSSAGKEDADDDDGEGTKKGGKGLRTELVNAVKKNGEVVTFAKLKADGLRSLVSQVVAEKGKKIEGAAAQMLAHYVSGNPSLLNNEVEKLSAYIGERETIRADDVEKVVSRSPEERIFQVIDAIGAGQTGQALKQLDETFASGAKPDTESLKVLAMMARHFRLLYQTKYLVNQGVRNLDAVPDELRAMLMRDPSPTSVHPFQKQNLPQQARSFSMEDIEGCLRQIMECEMAIKGIGNAGGSPRLNLEMLALRLSQRKFKIRS